MRRLFLVISGIALIVALAAWKGGVTKTTAATNVGTATATLNAQGVCESGANCVAWFQYWKGTATSPTSWKTTPHRSYPSGSTQKISVPVSELLASGTYSYRLATTTNGERTLRYDSSGTVGGKVYSKFKTLALTSRPSNAKPCDWPITEPVSYDHVVWVIEENHTYEQAVGSPNAPYFNSLIKKCGLFATYFAVTHPSLPNYIAMTSGSTHGLDSPGALSNGVDPAQHPLTGSSIFSQLGTGARSLQETMATNCEQTNNGGNVGYAARHNPEAYFTDSRSLCKTNDVPWKSPTDISARFTFVTPNLCNDGHSSGCAKTNGQQMTASDEWLQAEVPKILDSSEYAEGKTLLIIVWDEDDRSLDNRVAIAAIAPTVENGQRDNRRFTAYSLLGTTEDILGVPRIGNAVGAGSMRRLGF